MVLVFDLVLVHVLNVESNFDSLCENLLFSTKKSSFIW